MTFIEILTKALEKTKKNEDGFYFQLVVLEAEKSGIKKSAQMKLQVNDEVVQHIFDNLDQEVRFGICIPREIWKNAVDENNEKKGFGESKGVEE